MKQQGHEAKASQPAPDLLRLTNGLVTRDFLLQVPTLSQLPQNLVLVVNHCQLKMSPACICNMGLAQLRGGFLDSASIFSGGSSRCQNTRGRGAPIGCIDFIHPFSQHIHFPANHKFRKAVNVTVGGVEGGAARGYLNRTGLRERIQPVKGHSLTFVSYSVKNIR